MDKLEGQSPEQLQKEIDGLKRQLARARQEHSSPKSERRKPHRIQRKPDEDKKPQTGGKRTTQPALPLQEQTLELPRIPCSSATGYVELVRTTRSKTTPKNRL